MKELMAMILVGVYMTVLLSAYLKEKKAQAQGKKQARGHRHGGGIEIDVYAHQSQLRNINPTVKVAFSVIVLLLAIILDNPLVSLAILAAMAYLTMIKGGLSFHKYFRVLTIPIGFIILGTVTIGIEFSQTPLLDYSIPLGFFYINSSKAKIIEMFLMMVKVFAAVSALQMMTLTTPSAEIIGVMRKARMPKLIIELMNMIYRYIFILLEVYGKMKNSAESRLGYIDLKRAYFSFASIAANLLVVSMKKATAYYNAMEARCYDGDLVFLEDEKKIRPIDILGPGIFILAIIGIAIISE